MSSDEFTKFSRRVCAHPSVAVDPDSPASEGKPQVLAMRDELLVSSAASNEVITWLDQQLQIRPTTEQPISSLFRGSGHDSDEDVELWQLDLGPQLAADQNAIFKIAREARGQFDSLVSPNHVLVPASNGDECPYGPPWAVDEAPRSNGNLHTAEPITVIDCGYYWPHDQSWGENPLHEICTLRPVRLAKWWDNGRLADEPEEELGVDGDATLPLELAALAGHANFAAGVIARYSDNPTITIWTHNGGFRKSPKAGWGTNNLFVPTEHSVARSLIMSQQSHPTPVIYMSFAFAATDNTPGPNWHSAMKQIGNSFVVVPAGNHGDPTTPRFPGALRTEMNEIYPNIITVGALERGGKVLVHWSDSGDWVDCSAIGEDVVSTFLRVGDRQPEEWDPRFGVAGHNWDFAQNAWAQWSGTCFAAPKVAAALAIAVHELKTQQPDADPMQAWANLTGNREQVKTQRTANGDIVEAHGGFDFSDLDGDGGVPA
jgi:hypothetical protein